MEYKDQVVWLLTEILKAIKAQRPKKRNRRVQGDLWVRGKKMDRIDVATQEWEESQERLRRELEAERERKAREVKHGVVNGEAAKVAEQLMAKSRRMMG